MPNGNESEDAKELLELRAAVNNTRSILRSIQNQARAAVRLAYDLDERLERFDTTLQSRQHQAQEAKHGTQNPQRERQPARA